MVEVTEEIPNALDGQRVDRVVSLMTGLSRNQASTTVESGLTAINGRIVTKTSTRVKTGDVLVVNVDEPSDPLAPDASVSVDIAFVDDHLIVVDKAAGLVVHPGAGVETGTLIHGLVARFPDLLALRDLDDPPVRPGIVHRLDRGTSGLLVVARTSAAKDSLADQLRVRTMVRRYVTLVAGHVESESGLIDAPLGRSRRSPTVRAVVADGRPARTHYNVVERFDEPECSLVDVRLETGRTHQIRAHFDAVGHRVMGDGQYGDDDVLAIGRPFLHAGTLGFTHPETDQWLDFDSPLPPDLSGALVTLRGG